VLFLVWFPAGADECHSESAPGGPSLQRRVATRRMLWSGHGCHSDVPASHGGCKNRTSSLHFLRGGVGVIGPVDRGGVRPAVSRQCGKNSIFATSVRQRRRLLRSRRGLGSLLGMHPREWCSEWHNAARLGAALRVVSSKSWALHWQLGLETTRVGRTLYRHHSCPQDGVNGNGSRL